MKYIFNVLQTLHTQYECQTLLLMSHIAGVLLEPHVNVKNPMVRKPVHMMKPRVVTLQKSLPNSLEKRQHDLSKSGTNKSPSKSGSGSLLSYDGELSGKITHLKLDPALWSCHTGKWGKRLLIFYYFPYMYH